MIGHTLNHENELHSLIIEGLIEGIPRTKYISQIMQDVGVTTCIELKDMESDRER